MNAGAYKHRVTIEKNVHSYDDYGNPMEEWIPYMNAFAYVNGLSGKEYWDAAVLNAESTLDFVFRWNRKFDGVNPQEYRLMWNGSAYNIRSIDNIKFKNDTVKLRAVTSDGRH